MDSIQDKRKNTKNGGFSDIIARLKKIKNIEVAIAIVILAIILVIYTSTSSIKKSNASTLIDDNSSNSSDVLESNLEQILMEMSGAGNVKVMITYDGKVEYVTANTSNVNTSTSYDGNRTNETTSTTTSPVIVSNQGSSGPVILKEIVPDIKGVIVVAEGADDVIVRLEIMRAVMVALNIGAENIEIFAMK